MQEELGDWEIRCDSQTFEKAVKDERFHYILTLARSVNALRFVHVAMVHAGESDAPEAKRARFNSYLFASAILYESFNLIRAMNQTFKDEAVFQNGLRLFLRDKIARTIERNHLDPLRNGAVFHFLPDRFKAIVENAPVDTCSFVMGRGGRNRDVYYAFADILAGEILMGYASNSEEFYAQVAKLMANTRDLVVRFADEAEKLISYHLKEWGFMMAFVPTQPTAEL